MLSEQKQAASCRDANWGKIYRCLKLDQIWSGPEMNYGEAAQNRHSSFFIKAQGSFRFKEIEKYWCGCPFQDHFMPNSGPLLARKIFSYVFYEISHNTNHQM